MWMRPERFEQEYLYMRKGISCTAQTSIRQFRNTFGVTSFMCSVIWYKLEKLIPQEGRPKHLLFALLFLCCYATEHVNAMATGADEKTFRLCP